MDAARRERRHHRKAAAAGAVGVGGVGGGGGAAAARAAYGDVFGGPPRFAAPFGAAPLDYAEVFGGVAATCSIPYLDLPPAPSLAAAEGFFACRGKGDYGEIFGRFDFADFALPYEDLFGEPQPEPVPDAAGETDPEVASSSGSSTRSSFRKESSQLEDEPSILPQHYQNLDHHQHFKDHKFSPISFSTDTESPQFVMSYNKTAERRPDDLIEMMTCTVKPSVDFVIDSRNSLHGPATNHVSRIDYGTMANDDSNKKPSPANTSVRSAESDFAVGQKQQSQSWTPISGSISANENHKNSDSHSTRSTVTPPDYAFLRVSDSDTQTQSIKVQQPLKQQPKLLNKKESAAKEDVRIVDDNCSPTSAHITSSSNMSHTDKKVDANPTSASAAMKEAMNFAEARLKAAKALLEGKGDSFKLRKKPSHLKSTRSTEIKSPISVEADTSEQKLWVKKSSEEEKNPDDSLSDKHKKLSAVRLDHFDDNGKKVLPLEKPEHMVQHCTESCQTSSKLQKLGNWKSGNDFFELTRDDQKCKNDEATEGGDKCEQMNPITSVINDHNEIEFNAAGSDLDRYEKLWEVNDGRSVGVKPVNLRENKTAPVDKDSVSVILESSTENKAHQKTHNSIGEGLVTLKNAKESHGTDKCLELPSMSGASTKLDVFKDVSGSFPEARSSVNASDLGDHGNISPNLSPLAGTSQEDTTSKLVSEVSCDGGMQHTSRSNEKLQESSDVSDVAISQGSNIKSFILEELKESDVCDAFMRGPNGKGQEAENYGREKFSFIDGSLLLRPHFHNKGAKMNVISEEVQKVKNEEKLGPCTHPEVTIVDLDGDCPKDLNDVILQNDDFADPEESNMPNVFEVASKLIKRDLDQEMHGSLGHGEEENMEEGTDVHLCDINGKEVDETLLENSACTDTEEGCAHYNQEDQNSSDSTNRGKSDVDNMCYTSCDEVRSESFSGDEVVIKATIDSTARTFVNLKDEQVLSSEMYTRMQHSMQKDGTAAFQTSGGVPGLEEIGDVSNRGGRELSTERSTCEDHGNTIIMEEKDTTTRISKAEHASSPLETMCGVTKSAEAPTTVPTVTRKKEAHGVQRTKERENMTTADSACEKDKGSSQRVQEENESERRLEKEREVEEKERRKLEKERELAEEKERRKFEKERELAEEKERRKMEKEKEHAEEKERSKLEKEKELAEEKERHKLKKERELAEEKERRRLEEAERERERKKDRLAVERATREAHERAFAEAREKAEKMALERINAARQRASAEAREKEDRASVEPAAERASREARIKAERAAVERATAEARERAIEKAKAEKALAEARERRERYKSSFKESFKSTNQDIRQESQFQRATSSNFIRNPDSSNRAMVEVESALRHKARLERHQRTTERVTKALAEKNMRDLLAQREQAEKHRLSEFLDPEIKRWSNGKEGNLRALLSTLQYILGADSGWQPVPLTDLITAVAVKKAYRKATLCVHPDKLQQRGATIRQKYICEKVFDLLKDAWNKFTSEER
ncbi:Auxilin-like protein 1 [Zea mays]|uniref:Auxilin-like protein 1 n=1 Tax=Zea mays TaxID=4577 RepID=A0A3L6EBW3_MAIZE|nr:Auxilin-like protein 1 [Zea mays]